MCVYIDNVLGKCSRMHKCSRNAARRGMKVLGIHRLATTHTHKLRYSENFQPSACRVPRTFGCIRDILQPIILIN